MTRYTLLERFAADDRIEPRHIALFHVVTECWVAEGKSIPFEFDHDLPIRLSKLGKTTYRKTLKELNQWQYICYKKPKSRYMKPTLSFAGMVSGSDKMPPRMVSDSTTMTYCKPVMVSGFTNMNSFMVSESDRMTSTYCGMVSECTNMKPVMVSESTNIQPSMVSESGNIGPFHVIRIYQHEIVKTPSTLQNGTFVDNPGSGATDFVPRVRVIPSPNKQVILGNQDSLQDACEKGKGVQGKNRKKGKQGPSPVGTTFAESPYFDIAQFRQQFARDQTYTNVDLAYYHARLLNWTDQKTGQKPIVADWIAMAKNFMLNDLKKSELVTLTNPSSTNGQSSHHRKQRSTPRIEPAGSTTGRQFGAW